MHRNIFEAAIAQVAIEQLALRIPRLGLKLLDFRIHVAVADENIRPAVVIHVEKPATPAQILSVRAQARGKGRIFKTAVAEVVVERGRVAGEVRFYDVQVPVHIVVGRRYSHAGLRLAIGAERATGFHGDVHELAVLLVLVEGAGRGIVGYIDVGPAVIVEVGGEHAEPEGSISLQNP